MKMTKVDALNVALVELRALNTTNPTLVPNAVEAIEVLEGMVAQLSKPRKTSDEAKVKAKAKRADARAALMEQVLPTIREAVADGGTAKEIFERCADALPKDFTAAKVQYILLHELADEVVKTEAKNKPNIYTMKG